MKEVNTLEARANGQSTKKNSYAPHSDFDLKKNARSSEYRDESLNAQASRLYRLYLFW